ncbi:MAG: hypothetical protein AAGI88_13180, partial [Pseudomonadota bacterium]
EPEEAVPYLRKAKHFVDSVCASLAGHPTRHYTRIQALLMQNLVPTMPLRDGPPNPPRGEHGAAPRSNALTQAWQGVRLIVGAASRLRPVAERRSLRTRLPLSDRKDQQ